MRRCLSGASVGAFLLAWLGLGIAPVVAAPSDVEALVADWLEAKRDFYDLRPELQETAGSGWKPYNRLKWFHEQRAVDGVEPEVGARYRVWELKREYTRDNRFPTSWFSVGPSNYSGRVLALAFDPNDANVLYAGSAGGGLWKSTNAGVTWAAMTDEQPTLAVGGVCVLPSNSNVVLIGTGEGTLNIDRIGGVGILKSTDAGLTWSSTGLSYSVGGGHGFHVLRANPLNDTILAGATDGLWRSTDAGDTWTQVKSGGNYYDVQWKPGDASRVYCCKGNDGSGNNIKVSTDDGVTWGKAGSGQPASFDVGKTKLAVTAADSSRVYAIIVNSGTSGLLGVYRTTDDGANWALRASTPNIPGGQGWYNLSLAADPDNAERIVTGGVQLYRSNDGGSTYTQLSGSVHVDHHDAVYRPGSPDNVFVASDGGVWESTNDGASWMDRNTGLVTYQFYDICVNNNTSDPNFIMGGTQDQGTDRWSGTTSWNQGLGGDGMVCNINPVNGSTVFAEIQFGVHYKNTSAGTGGWTQVTTGITGNSAWVTPVDQDQNLGRHLWTSTSDGMFRTTNSANTWEQHGTQTATWISISPVDGDITWTVNGLGVMLTTDDGGTWSSTGALPTPHGSATKILAHPTNADVAFVTFSGYSSGFVHVARTTDQGTSWHDVTGNFPDQPVNAIAVDPLSITHWFVGTDVGVWVTVDGGTTWTPFDTGFPNTVVCDLEIQTMSRKLFAGTHGRGAWEVDISGVTSLDDEGELVVAPPSAVRRLLLDPPFPNPVIDETMLRFAARHDGVVTLDVYDITGRVVTHLSELSEGDGIVRMVPWYPENLPSGVYFAVLTAGRQQKTRKIVLTR